MTTPKKPRKPRRAKIWIARERAFLGDDNEYVLAIGSAPIPHILTNGKMFHPVALKMCPSLFHRATGFRLAPGEGPVEVKIEIRRKGKAR